MNTIHKIATGAALVAAATVILAGCGGGAAPTATRTIPGGEHATGTDLERQVAIDTVRDLAPILAPAPDESIAGALDAECGLIEVGYQGGYTVDELAIISGQVATEEGLDASIGYTIMGAAAGGWCPEYKAWVQEGTR